MKRNPLPAFCLVLAFATVGAASRPDAAAVGVVVEKVVQGEEAERAGIRPGDVLLSWKRQPNPPANPAGASGTFGTPFDVLETQIDQSPRARSLTVEYRRSGKRESAALLPYSWKVETRPAFSDARLKTYETGKRLIENGELEKGCQAWRDLADELSASGDRLGAAWVWLRTAGKQAEADRIDAASGAFDLGIAQARAAGRADVESQLWGYKGEVLAAARQFAEGEAALRRALAIREERSPDGLAVAHCLEALDNVTEARGAAYEAAQARALRIRQKLAPGSAVEAASLRDLAISSFFRGDLRRGIELQQQALAIHQRIDENGSRVAYAINNVCAFEVERGDLAAAEPICARSFALSRRFPGEVGLTLGSASLINLGEIALRRGDFERAREFQLRALALQEQAAGPEGIGWNLWELGDVALRRADFAEAEELYVRAEKLLRAEKRPNSGLESGFKKQLAETAYGRGDLPRAKSLLREAVAGRALLDPDGGQAASMYNALGRVLAELGETAEAETQLRRALGLRRKHSQSTSATAESSHNLGMVLWKTGRLPEAEAELRRSIEDLEAQQARLGGSEETRSVFAAEFADYYRDYLRLLIELGREEDAFFLLERYRAGSFLRTLAQRDLGASGDVPADLEVERRSTNAEYDRAQEELGDLKPSTQSKEIAEALARLSELRRKRAEIAEAIEKASPRYGALRYPRSSDVVAARATLDPGTLLLSYSVGREKSYLFALEAGGPKGGSGLSVYALPLGEKALRESVEALRRQIGRKEAPDLVARSRSLYDTLIKPAEALIGKHERLLVLPDGPLHKLPWAALVRRVEADLPQYLVAWKPLHTAVSATVYAELKKSRRVGSGEPVVEVAAFGDPRYSAPAPRKSAVMRSDGTEEEEDAYGDPELDAALRGGQKFEPLPSTRQEVETIASLYAPRSEAYVGTQATEERALSIGKAVPLIHFACHAYVNERFPLDSALVFTIPETPRPGQDNGLLQAWEIFEKVRIDADLVTLSACDSGLGKEMGGEGLIGLTRAFQYAGARTVLASLWKVEDASTAELMKRFYGYLKSGKTKDEALRLAQIDLIRSPSYSQPRDWAAFELMGDWK